jgi:hypothetical protein
MASFVDDDDVNVVLHPTKEEFHQMYFRAGPKYDTYYFTVGTPLFSSFRESLIDKTNAEIAPKVFPKMGNSYFGFHKETSMLYGYSFAYITNQPIRLLAIDSIKTMRYLWGLTHEIAEEEDRDKIQKALRTGYGWLDEYLEEGKSKYPPQIRNSFSGVDWPIVEFLCENGFPGYAANEMITPIGHKFHPECVICSNGPLVSVNLNLEYNVGGYPGLATPLDKFGAAESLMEKRKVDRGKPKKEKQETHMSVSPFKLSRSLNFDDDVDDVDDINNAGVVVAKKLFNDDNEKKGGTIMKKRKTQQRKPQKRKTQQRKHNTKKRQNKSRK